MNDVVQPIELPNDTEKISVTEMVQYAIDNFSADNNITKDDIEAMLSEHMRTPYSHTKE